MPVPLTLKKALRVEANTRLAFVGAGGKTTSMFRLAYDFASGVLVTTSTHLSITQSRFADRRHVIRRTADLIPLFEEDINGVVLLMGDIIDNGRISGLSPELLDQIKHYADRLGLPILIEADGSRSFPIKAPAEHEPAIPAWANHVVVVAGLNGIGQPLDGEHIHRPELYSACTGLPLGEIVTSESLIRELMHPQGGLKNIPDTARKSLILNQADTLESQAMAAGMAARLSGHFDEVLITSLKDNQRPVKAVYAPVAGIILAAGRSSRFGSGTKMLLDWYGQPFIRKVAQTALTAGLDPVIVIVGAGGEEVRQAVADLPVRVRENVDWESGQSSSIRCGIEALPENCGGAIFLLGDQPQVNPTILDGLVEEHRRFLHPIIAPSIDGKRANPVLFDRQTFPELCQLTGDVGGRAIFSRHPVEWLPWNDSLLLLDVDTPEDYRRLLDSFQIQGRPNE